MKRITIEPIRSKEASGHPDYRKNLQTTQNLILETSGKLPNGMQVKISDSHHIPKALTIISWKPGAAERRGNYATPVNMHQPKEQFDTELKHVVDAYNKVVREANEERPQTDWFNSKNLKDFALKV